MRFSISVAYNVYIKASVTAEKGKRAEGGESLTNFWDEIKFKKKKKFKNCVIPKSRVVLGSFVDLTNFFKNSSFEAEKLLKFLSWTTKRTC